MIKSVIWNSMVDYPKDISTVLFTGKCNFDCEFCYNQKLLKLPDLNFDKDVMPKLLQRKSFIDTVVITGGECTLESDFDDIVDKLYKNGFKVVIHTNGMQYDAVERNIDKLTYVAIDYKTSDAKYNLITRRKIDIDIIKKTIKFVIDSGADYEVRTTVYPKYVNVDDCVKIANMLKGLGAKKYFLQQYKITEDTPQITPYDDEYMKNLVEKCSEIIPTILK